MVRWTDTPPFGCFSREANSGSIFDLRSKRISEIPPSPKRVSNDRIDMLYQRKRKPRMDVSYSICA